MNNNIRKLNPAAARLLLAFQTVGPQDSYDDAVQASGVSTCLTLTTAKQQLRQLGFMVAGPNGEEQIVLRPEESTATEPDVKSSILAKFKATKARGM